MLVIYAANVIRIFETTKKKHEKREKSRVKNKLSSKNLED